MEINTPIEFRPYPLYPVYPPYHKGLYLEDYFIDYWTKNNFETDREFIAISWTSYYNNGMNRSRLQSYLDSLPKDKKYFTVCQHDDAPSELLPPNTLIFSAGGNVISDNIIPIPLICSSLELNGNTSTRSYLASFVGSMTHPIRSRMIQHLTGNSNFYLQYGEWKNTIDNSRLQSFIDVSLNSIFMLCPRGYGATSFRLYESFQLGCIPVYISDRFYLPFADKINWEKLCIFITPDEIPNIENRLKSISETEIADMLTYGKSIYEDFLTLDKTCLNIIKRI